MSDSIVDIFDEETEERFEVTENPVGSYSEDELFSKIDYQFRPVAELGQDHTDYMKYFMCNILGLSENDFPWSYFNILGSGNQKVYDKFMHKILYNMKYTFGISFDEESDNVFELCYIFYYFLIVDSASFIVDLLLYYHLYGGKDVNQYFKDEKKRKALILGDIFEKNPVDQIQSELDYYYKIKEGDDTEVGNITYKERFDFFISYANSIFGDTEEFNMYEIFEKLNTMNPCDNYEYVDEQIKINNAVKFEDFALISDEIIKRNFNINVQEDYINKSLIDPFFKYLANLDRMITQSIEF